MADKASRGLVLYGDGLMRLVRKSHVHLHSLASRASCGFLSLYHSPPHHHSGKEDERIVREFAQLVDSCEPYYLNETHEDIITDSASQKSLSKPASIGERFMGMRAALITNNNCLQAFAKKVGFTVLPKNDSSHVEPPLVDELASGVLNLLGFQDGKVLETSQFDIVFMHIGAGEEDNIMVANNVEYLNDLVGKILNLTPPGFEIASRLHFSVVLSYGDVTESDDLTLSVLPDKRKTSSNLSMLFPRQSYTVKGGNQRSNVRCYCPMLSAQVQEAVTRIDMANWFSFEDFKENCGNLTIPADRFLHEITFKLWKAPKYGA